MFQPPSRFPIQLSLSGQVLRFDSEEDFNFAIEGRTDIDGEDSAALMAMSDQRLKREIVEVEAEEQHLREHFNGTEHCRENLCQRLAEVQPTRWRQDHQWRQLLCAVTNLRAPPHALVRSAIEAYLEYLRTRVAVANAIVTRRQSAPETNVSSHREGPLQTSDIPAVAVTADRALEGGHATLVLDVHECVVAINFSRHRHRIERCPGENSPAANPIDLINSAGKHWRLPLGQSVVGRDRSCDIVLSGVLKDISRAHAMINVDGGGRVWVTDTSSKGTFVVEDVDSTPNGGTR